MAQGEVLEVLEKKGGWMNVNEILKTLKITRNAITYALRKLYKYHEVERREIKGGGQGIKIEWKYRKN